MSLADEWDALPAKPKGSLADEWDSITPADMKADKVETEKARPSTGDIVKAGGKAALDFAQAPARAAASAAQPAVDVVANQATALGNSIIGGWRGLTTLASGGSLDDAVKAVHGEDANSIARVYEPAQGSGGATLVEGMQHPANPMNWPSLAAGYMGKKTMDVTGSPAAATAVETTLNAVPLLLVKGGKTAAGERVVGSGSIAHERVPAIAKDTTNYDVPTYLRKREPVEAKPVEATPVEPATQTPVAPLTEKGAVQPVAASKFTEEAPIADTGKALPTTEQARRVKVLQAIGIDKARDSAVRGDMTAANTDINTAKLESPAGRALKTQLDSERAALTDHAEKIVRETGGTIGTDQSTLYARGNTILAPLDALKQWFTDQTTKLYAAARERGAGQPAELSGLKEALEKKSNFSGNTDTLQLRAGIADRMAELGMLDKDGNLLPSTVDQVENLRKYVNERWTPSSNGVIRTLKNTLDEDVTRAAGEDTFKAARSLHAMKKATLDDPKGIAKVMDSEGPINRAVDIEKVADTVAGLPADQLAHIVKTLQNVPTELRPQAQAALAEIKAHFANKIMDAGTKRVGQWGARDVTSYLSNNAARLPQVFKPEELAQIHLLNEAGQILRVEGGYPGAAVQEHNLVRSGVMHGIRSGAATIGALIGGPPGAAIGDLAGSWAARKVDEGATLRAAQKRVVKLSDFPK